MNEHEHEWGVGLHPKFLHAVVRCKHEGCAAWLTIDQANARLNATERLSAEDAKRALSRWLPADVSKAIRAYADILEGK